MQIAQQVVESRVDKIGVASPSVTVHGDELVVEFGDTHAPANVAKTIAITGRLEMFDFEPSLEPPSVSANQQPAPLPSLYKLLKAVQGPRTRAPRRRTTCSRRPLTRSCKARLPQPSSCYRPTKAGSSPRTPWC
jgi:preprotein translocase subunit SecD